MLGQEKECGPMTTLGTAGQVMRKQDITLRENIDAQIVQAQKNVESLEATKARMEKSGILDMRIDDINTATRW